MSTGYGYFFSDEELARAGWVDWLVIAAAVFAVGAVVYFLVRRFVLDTNKYAKTVPAVFITDGGKINIHAAMTKPSLAHISNAVLEEHVLTFRNEDNGKILKFPVSGSLNMKLKEQQKGMLTYSGKRFISFELE